MFLGSFKTYFSGKNRLILPKKIRKELGDTDIFYVLMGEDGEIWGLDKRNWDKLTEKVLETPLSSPDARQQRRKLFSFAEECVLDRQGRFILPGEFVDKAELKEEVVIVGAGDHFEIWDPSKWGLEERNLSRRT